MIDKATIQYITYNFGYSILEHEWVPSGKLPLYLRKGYSYREIEIHDIKLLLVDCSANHEQSVEKLQNHIRKLIEYSQYDSEVVLIFENATNYLRERLVEEKMPFVVPGRQIYIPILGTVLNERPLSRYAYKSKKAIQKMSPTTQALFLELMVSDDFNRPMEKIAGAINVTKMSISRAFTELCDMGLINERETDHNSRFCFSDEQRKIWDKAKRHFFDPVMKKIYVQSNSIDKTLQDKLVVSGESALSEYTNMGAPKHQVYGISSKAFKQHSGDATMLPIKDNSASVIEIWKHEMPRLNGLLHPLGVALLLNAENDERVHSELVYLIENYHWKEKI